MKKRLLGYALVLLSATLSISPASSIFALGGSLSYEFDDFVGVETSPMFNSQRFSTDSDGNFYVLDQSTPVLRKFSTSGETLLKIGTGDWATDNGEFGSADGVAVKSNGEIYVSNYDSSLINVYSPTGAHLRTISSPLFNWSNSVIKFSPTDELYVSIYSQILVFDSNDQHIDTITKPGGVDFDMAYYLNFDANGDLYVTDNHGGYPTSSIFAYDSNRTFLREMTSADLGYDNPGGIALSGDGHMYIAYDSDKSVRKFTTAGAYVSSIQEPIGGVAHNKFHRLYDIDVTPDGKLHTLEGIYDRIQTFAPDGSYLSQFGNGGTEAGQFHAAHAITVDDDDNIYVGDSDNARIQVFDSDGNFLRQFGQAGTEAGEFNGRIIDVEINPANGHLYVSEWTSYYARIQVFSLSGNFINSFSGYGSADGQIGSARMTFDDSGNLYLSDPHNMRIQVLDSDGNFLHKWTVSAVGGVSNYGSQLGGLDIDPEGNINVISGRSSNIAQYSPSGDYLGVIGYGASQGSGDGQTSGADDIIIDDEGFIYIADELNNRIQVLDSTGTFVYKLGTIGENPDQFFQPVSVALDSTKKLIVADSLNNRVSTFTLAGSQPVVTPPSQPIDGDPTTPATPEPQPTEPGGSDPSSPDGGSGNGPSEPLAPTGMNLLGLLALAGGLIAAPAVLLRKK